MGYAAILTENPVPEMTDVKMVKTGSQEDGTNNIAEWLALISGMQLMLKHWNECWLDGPITVQWNKYRIYTDSNLIVGQANGRFRVRNEGLRPFYKMFREIEKACKNIDFEIVWIARRFNKTADTYSKLANPYFKDKIKNGLSTPKGSSGPYESGHRSIEDNGKPKGRSGPGFRFA